MSASPCIKNLLRMFEAHFWKKRKFNLDKKIHNSYKRKRVSDTESLVDLVLGTGEWMLMAGETYFDEHTVALSCLNIFSSNSMS